MIFPLKLCCGYNHVNLLFHHLRDRHNTKLYSHLLCGDIKKELKPKETVIDNSHQTRIKLTSLSWYLATRLITICSDRISSP